MQADLLNEARRQAEICNACRYCESYCAVFPDLHQQRAFSDGDLTQFANLCHNCRACYYACQYTAPHEFDLNLPKILAEVRAQSWEDFAWPKGFAQLFQERGSAVAVAATAAFALILFLIFLLPSAGGDGFYAAMSHNVMIAIFIPSFLLPVISLTVSLRTYWKTVGGQRLSLKDWLGAFRSIALMKNLSGGHGKGCNFEDEDRFTQGRRHTHQAILWGFVLCLASTSVATLMHYLLSWPAPYPWWSPPKLLGIPGGLLLTAGCVGMFMLKLKSDRSLGVVRVWGGEVAFILLLGFIGLSGLVLYILGSTSLMTLLLALHLGAVLAFFLLTPFFKMAHGFYRLAALLRSVQNR